MKHASPATLARLAPLLAGLRGMAGLAERKPGIFYRKSAAFLHFHEDPAGVFADVKLDGRAFTRVEVGTLAGQRALLAAVGDLLRGR